MGKSNKKTLHEELITFARIHPQIKAIYKGINPGKEELAYYFLTGRDSHYDRKLEDKISELDLRLHNNLAPKNQMISLYAWPVDPKNAHKTCSFLEECIWER